MLALVCAGCAALPRVRPPALPTPPWARPDTPITFRQLLDRPRQKATFRLSYGPDALQFGELWLPNRPGPHPVVVLIHGGCWQASLPGLELMDYMAAELRDEGYAVWNVEYRRIGSPGGGYPGTFTDVSQGVDHLRHIAGTYHLDLQRVAISGHSAGGHLAAWAAARKRIPPTSPLHTPDPLPMRGVVTLAGINDLWAYRQAGPEACGGPATIDALTGAGTRGNVDLYADTSPPKLLPVGIPQRILSGERDHIVPPKFGFWYGTNVAHAGDPVEIDNLPGGHFELIDPRSAAWPRIEAEITSLLR